MRGHPVNFPLPSAHSDSFSVLVEYKAHETTVQLSVDPVTVHLPSMVFDVCCFNDYNYCLGA